MARLNISIPDDLYKMTLRWRTRVNLSEVCARALQQELDALEFYRSAGELFSALRPPTSLENALVARYGLSEALVLNSSSDDEDLRESLGELAGDYLNRYLCDGSLLAIGGGRQMWCVVRSLKPRQLSITITGLGIEQNDPRVLHAHSNTLTTLLWLLFSPRANAQIVGRDDVNIGSIWRDDLPKMDHPQYFIIGSCGPFVATGPLASLVGREGAQNLLDKNVCGDFLYQFFDEDGHLLDPPPLDRKSILSSDTLRHFSQRPDAKVILVAGGAEKLRSMHITLTAGLCNVLLTDTVTAQKLIEQ